LVGVCSYLLVSFWFTRIAANQSSLSAFLTNRVGDCFLTIGMFAILWGFGNSINALNKFNVSGNRSSRPCSFNCSKKKSRSLVRNFSGSHRPTNPLNPYFVTGFSDAESSFSVSIAKSTKQGKGCVMCRFDINLHKKDLDLLNSIKDFFGVGKVYLNTNDSCIYTVQSIKDLAIIINHFNNYPLITQKLGDFILFKLVYDIVNCKDHLTKEGLNKILSLKASINRGLTNELKLNFPDIIPASRPLVINQVIKDPNWLSGFVTGEGCFLVDIMNSKSNAVGKQVVLKFQVTQCVRDINLLKSLNSYLVGGKYYQGANRDRGDFRVQKFSDIFSIIIPFFKNYPIHGVKAKDFADFCKVADIVHKKNHLTASGINEIIRIKSVMNRGRDLDININEKEKVS